MIGGRFVTDTVIPGAFPAIREACGPDTMHPWFLRNGYDPSGPAGQCESATAGFVTITERQTAIRLSLILGRLVTYRAFIDNRGKPKVKEVPLIETHIWAHYAPPGIELKDVYLYDMTPDQAKGVCLPAPICGTYDELESDGVFDIETGENISLFYKPRLIFPTIAAMQAHCDTFEGNDLGQRLPNLFENLAAAAPLGRLALR